MKDRAYTDKQLVNRIALFYDNADLELLTETEVRVVKLLVSEGYMHFRDTMLAFVVGKGEYLERIARKGPKEESR